jgi:enoyl-CoA hydratase/carnithine racemase
MDIKDIDKVICGYLSEVGVNSSRCHFFIRGDEDDNYLVCDVAGEMDTLAVAMTKAAMYRGLHEHDLAAHMDYEVYIMNILFSTEDFQEGMNSLFEKREPIFKGK